MYFALSSQSQINGQELQTLEKMRELFALLFATKDPIIDPDRILDPLVKGFKESGDIKGIAINGAKYPQDQQVPRTLQNMVIDNIIDCEGCFGFT